MLITENLLSRFDPVTGIIPGAPLARRHLSDLRGCFANNTAFELTLAADNPLVYTVCSVESAGGDGDLHYGVGRLLPGHVGDEYFMTKGHLHSWREAAEVYIGVTGEGMMLLEDETTGESRLLELRPQGVVYVPGNTAHRTINVGSVPLIYLGIYPAKAGHDYVVTEERNFRYVVLERNGEPAMIERNKLVCAITPQK